LNLFGDVPSSGTGYFANSGKVTKTPLGTPQTPEYPVAVKSYTVSFRMKRAYGHLIFTSFYSDFA